MKVIATRVARGGGTVYLHIWAPNYRCLGADTVQDSSVPHLNADKVDPIPDPPPLATANHSVFRTSSSPREACEHAAPRSSACHALDR